MQILPHAPNRTVAGTPCHLHLPCPVHGDWMGRWKIGGGKEEGACTRRLATGNTVAGRHTWQSNKTFAVLIGEKNEPQQARTGHHRGASGTGFDGGG